MQTVFTKPYLQYVRYVRYLDLHINITRHCIPKASLLILMFENAVSKDNKIIHLYIFQCDSVYFIQQNHHLIQIGRKLRESFCRSDSIRILVISWYNVKQYSNY